MDKITDLTDVRKYYCTKCKHFHIRKYLYKINKEGKRIKTKDTPFFNHKEFAMKLISSEFFKRQFNKSCDNYTVRKHKKTQGSSKQ